MTKVNVPYPDTQASSQQEESSALTPSQQRKEDHIQLCYQGDVGLSGDPGLWSEIQLIHNALPELNLSDLSTETNLFDRFNFSAPIMLTGMTGGTHRAAIINRGIARLCNELSIPFGLGSMRILAQSEHNPQLLSTFRVRTVAPKVCLMGNIGVNQLRDLGVDQVKRMCDQVDANILAIHLNPAMELIQPGRDADSDFTSGYKTIEEACETIGRPVIVKECGCGLSPQVVNRLVNAGVRCVDVSGVGGTSWVKLEALRAEGMDSDSEQARLGHLLADWGIPTAAAVLLAAPSRAQVIASGGITNALEAVKALSLGADMVGLARPVLQAFLRGYDSHKEGELAEEAGYESARAFLLELSRGIRVITALTGARSTRQLRDMPKLLGPKLRTWETLKIGGK